MVPGQTEANVARFKHLFSESEIGKTERAQVQRIIQSQDIEFQASDLELGYRYEDGATIGDGSPSPESDPLGQHYIPVTRPGHRLPHVWLAKGDGKVSTHDLVGNKSRFVLITDEHGVDWISAVTKLNGSLDIVGVQIPVDDKATGFEYKDTEERWQGLRGIQNGGAILVRPDNFVAWRSNVASVEQGKELVVALETLVGKSLN